MTTRWQCWVTHRKGRYALGMRYNTPIDTVVALWDSLHFDFLGWEVSINRFRITTD